MKWTSGTIFKLYKVILLKKYLNNPLFIDKLKIVSGLS